MSATDAKQRFAAVLDTAQREPVVIRRQKRDVAVVLSLEQYERLRGLNADEFQRFCDRVAERPSARGLTEDKLAEILADDGSYGPSQILTDCDHPRGSCRRDGGK